MPIYDLSEKRPLYGRYVIKSQATATGYNPSDVISIKYDVGATITINNGIINVINVISGVASFDIYADNDNLIGTVDYSEAINNGIEITDYTNNLDDGKHFISLCSKGNGIADNRSNKVPIFVGVQPIYGVSGLYNSNPILTRTDDAIDMNFVIDDSTGEIASDFNDVFPWNECEIVDDAAGKFLSFPTMYFRVGADDNNRLTDIAVSKQPTNEGEWYKVEPFMYGCYGASASGSTIKSVSNAERLTSVTRSSLRVRASANGNGYYQLDLYHHTVLTFLWYIEFATKNSQSIMTGRVYGSGNYGGSSKCRTGGTDSLGTPSGFETAYGQMRYHYIEDFVGNVMEYIDGVCCKGVGEHDYVTNNPADFSDDITNKSPLSYAVPGNNWLCALGWDSEHPFMCMPAETNGGNETKYFCDYSGNANSSFPVLYFGAYCSNASTNHGLSCFYRSDAGSAVSFRGGRLLKS